MFHVKHLKHKDTAGVIIHRGWYATRDGNVEIVKNHWVVEYEPAKIAMIEALPSLKVAKEYTEILLENFPYAFPEVKPVLGETYGTSFSKQFPDLWHKLGVAARQARMSVK